jgi:hypothetical protein
LLKMMKINGWEGWDGGNGGRCRTAAVPAFLETARKILWSAITAMYCGTLETA